MEKLCNYKDLVGIFNNFFVNIVSNLGIATNDNCLVDMKMIQ